MSFEVPHIATVPLIISTLHAHTRTHESHHIAPPLRAGKHGQPRALSPVPERSVGRIRIGDRQSLQQIRALGKTGESVRLLDARRSIACPPAQHLVISSTESGRGRSLRRRLRCNSCARPRTALTLSISRSLRTHSAPRLHWPVKAHRRDRPNPLQRHRRCVAQLYSSASLRPDFPPLPVPESRVGFEGAHRAQSSTTSGALTSVQVLLLRSCSLRPATAVCEERGHPLTFARSLLAPDLLRLTSSCRQTSKHTFCLRALRAGRSHSSITRVVYL